MKIFLMIITAALMTQSACTQVQYQQIPGNPPLTQSTEEQIALASGYLPTIDILVAFLWPEFVRTPQDKVLLKEIILDARLLKSEKEKFQAKRFLLKKEYKDFECEKHPNDDRCIEIEDAIVEHDGGLVEIYRRVETIKQNVSLVGGEWLETNMDYPSLPLSSVDFSKASLTLTVFGKFKDAPLAYQFSNAKIYNDVGFQRFVFEAQRKDEQGFWQIEVAPSQNEFSLLFQGELYWVLPGKTRQGFIYWEHLKIYD